MKVVDYRYETRCAAFGGTPFRIRLYTTHLYPVVIASTLYRSDITIDPLIDSYLAADVAARHRDLLPDGQPFVWIAHSLHDVYARVLFATFRARAAVNHGIHRPWFGLPTWRTITCEEVVALTGEWTLHGTEQPSPR